MKIIKPSQIPEEKKDGYAIRRLITESLKRPPENFGFYLTTIPAGKKVKYHFHPLAVEIIIFLTEGTIKLRTGFYDFSPNDIIVLQSKEKHEIIAKDKEVKLIAIRVPNFPDDKVVC